MDDGREPLLGSEFLREGESAGLPRCGVAGAEAEKTWLALRAEKGKRADEDDPAEGGRTGDDGCSCSGVEGVELRAGEGERRAGRADRNRLDDGRLVGDGAWCCESSHSEIAARGQKETNVVNML